jgi:hypothetical protein
MALKAAEEASAQSGLARHTLDCIFASALGDGSVAHAVLSALTRENRPVSPTHFHNSVHNATAGYWSIGTGNREAATSLAAGDGTFGSALLKALMTLNAENRPVELVAVEHPFPEPLGAERPVGPPLAVALVLVPVTDGAPPGAGEIDRLLELDGIAQGPASPPRIESLRELWRAGPVGRALPLLETLTEAGSVVIEAGDGYFLSLKISAP